MLTCLEKYLKKLLGKNDIEDALKKLDTLTMEEARMAIAETLKVTNRVDDTVNKMDDKVDRVDDNVMELIDGGGTCISLLILIYAFLNTDMAANKRSADATDEEKRSFSKFLPLIHGLIYPHREPVTGETTKVALTSRSLDKP